MKLTIVVNATVTDRKFLIDHFGGSKRVLFSCHLLSMKFPIKFLFKNLDDQGSYILVNALTVENVRTDF